MSAQPAQLELPVEPEPAPWTDEQLAFFATLVPALNRDIQSIAIDNDIAAQDEARRRDEEINEDFEGDAADERERQFPEYRRDDPRR